MLSREEYLKLPLKDRFIKLSKTEDERATELHEKLISVDLHSHITSWNQESGWERRRIRNSGVTCFFEALDPIWSKNIAHNFDVTMRQLGSLFAFVRKQTDMTVAFCTEDIRKAKGEDKQVVMAQLEPQTIGPRLDLIDIAYGLGIRMMLLTLNYRNFIGDGCAERADSGLSYYGLEVIDKMNHVGMMIDVAHCGVKTTLETIEASKDPVVVSHAGAHALNPSNKRLKTDDEIKALAEKGGVIGIHGGPNMLANTKRQGIQDLLKHVDYIANLVGADHVAVGLDIVFDDFVALFHSFLVTHGAKGTAKFMEGIESPEEWPNITRGLVLRGYSDQEIKKIIGGNALKIMDRIIG